MIDRTHDYPCFYFPKCYISGAVTGTTDYVERFKKAEKEVRNLGFEPVNPVEVNASLPPITSWKEYMRMSITMLFREDCRTIYMLPGWRDSTGARVEHELAVGAGYNIIYADEPTEEEIEEAKKRLNSKFGIGGFHKL